MEISRRDALGLAAAFAVAANHLDPAACGQAMANQPSGPAVDVAGYWSRFYDEAGVTRGGPKGLAANSRKTLYVHSPDNNKPLMFADTMDISTLPALQGDLRARLAISQYRPGKGDISTDISHLRIDAAQGFDYGNLLAPLSWAAIASITPDKKTGQIPPLDQLGFHAQTDATNTNLKQVTLPGGTGKLAFNVTRPANDLFTQIVKSSSTAVTAALSIMTLPAISVPAIKVFTELFGKWQSHATVIMNGNLTPVIGTSALSSGAEAMPQQPMALKSGYYVMLPEAHRAELAEQFDQLTIFNGFLVRKDAPPGQDLPTRAQNAVQGVSYATLRINVDQMPASGCSPKTA